MRTTHFQSRFNNAEFDADIASVGKVVRNLLEKC
jgi:hypothetical protein